MVKIAEVRSYYQMCRRKEVRGKLEENRLKGTSWRIREAIYQQEFHILPTNQQDDWRKLLLRARKMKKDLGLDKIPLLKMEEEEAGEKETEEEAGAKEKETEEEKNARRALEEAGIEDVERVMRFLFIE